MPRRVQDVEGSLGRLPWVDAVENSHGGPFEEVILEVILARAEDLDHGASPFREPAPASPERASSYRASSARSWTKLGL